MTSNPFVIEPRDVLDYALAHGWTVVTENDRATALRAPGLHWEKQPPIVHIPKSFGDVVPLAAAVHVIAEHAGMPFYQLCAQFGYEKATAAATQRRRDYVQTILTLQVQIARLYNALLHGLGLANELGEGERWANWRLSAHTTLNSVTDDKVIALIAVSRAWLMAIERCDGVDAAERALKSAVEALEAEY